MTTDSTLPPPELDAAAVTPSITAAPKLRQVYWCDFWQDARLPEMWKNRPVVVVSYKNTLHGPCTVIPFSTKDQGSSPWAWKVSIFLDGRESWAICNHPYTVSPSRFSQVRGAIPLMPKTDFNEILARLTLWLPKPFPIDK